MALVKSRKPVDLNVKVPQSLFDEIKNYCEWADVSEDDIVSQAIEMLFKNDKKWNNENIKNHSNDIELSEEPALNKTDFIKTVYAEIVCGKHTGVNEEIGKVSSGSVFRVVRNYYKRNDIAHGTCTAQTTTCNKFLLNRDGIRQRSPVHWNFLRGQIEKLGGKIPE